jgi:hypothetical protein
MSTRVLVSLAITLVAIGCGAAVFFSFQTVGRMEQQQQQIFLLQAKINQLEQSIDGRISQIRARRRLPRLVQVPTPKQGSERHVLLRNDGFEGASITKIVFVVEDVTRVPAWSAQPPASPDAADGVRIAFAPSEYDPSKQRFAKTLDAPPSVPGGASLMLRIGVDDPAQLGRLYLGSLEIHYGSSMLSLPNLGLPVLATASETAKAEAPSEAGSARDQGTPTPPHHPAAGVAQPAPLRPGHEQLPPGPGSLTPAPLSGQPTPIAKRPPPLPLWQQPAPIAEGLPPPPLGQQPEPIAKGLPPLPLGQQLAPTSQTPRSQPAAGPDRLPPLPGSEQPEPVSNDLSPGPPSQEAPPVPGDATSEPTGQQPAALSQRLPPLPLSGQQVD